MIVQRSARWWNAHLGEAGLQAWLDGELDVDSTVQFVRHLRVCALCRTRLSWLLDGTNQVARLFSVAGIRRACPRKRSALSKKMVS
jgi:Putative zinc-finger